MHPQAILVVSITGQPSEPSSMVQTGRKPRTMSLRATVSSSASIHTGVYVPAMRTKMEEWSSRRSQLRVRGDQLPLW